MRVHIDFETRSTVNIAQTGVYPYAMHKDTALWCMAFTVADDDEPDVWTPGKAFPEVLLDNLGDIEFHAWNANFERVMWWLNIAPALGIPRPEREQFVCTAAAAAALALPRKLADCARVVECGEQIQSHKHGLILRMAKPRRIHNDGTVEWWTDPERLESLYEACRQDVRTERAISKKLRALPPTERAIYLLDQRMNDRGVQLDTQLIEAAGRIVDTANLRAERELTELTDGELTSLTRTRDMTNWLVAAGAPIDNLRKDTVRDILGSDVSLPEDVRRVLVLRQDTAKTSTAKLSKMLDYACPDGRARGMLLYHGASTGRWSGKGPQPQNYARPLVNAEKYIAATLRGDYDAIAADHAPLVVVSSMLRSMLVAGPGKVFLAADYAQIEARVTAWLAGQEDLVELFATGGKVYEDMAATIYGVPIDDIRKDSNQRQIGKMAVLGCGFGMGGAKFAEQVRTQVGIDMGEEEAKRVVSAYRIKNSKIARLWHDLDRGAREAVLEPGRKVSSASGRVRWLMGDTILWCELPSRRLLAYSRPRVERDKVVFQGVNSYTRRWEERSAYGGLWTENVVQAIARDLMAHAMLRAEAAGIPPVLTIHDEVLVEVVAEADDGTATVADLVAIMEDSPSWAEGLPIKAEGWSGPRYRK